MSFIINHVRNGISTLTTALKLLNSLNNDYTALLNRAISASSTPVPNPTEPYWMESPLFPELDDDTSKERKPLPSAADVVIIGTGITGAAAAKTLLELAGEVSEQNKIVALDARKLCSGATGRNGGHIKAGPHTDFALMRRKLGSAELARDVVRFEMRHLPALLELGEKIPEAEVREVETVDVFVERGDFEKAKRAIEEVRVWMPDLEICVFDGEEARKKFDVNEFIVGAVSYTAGALWPFRLVTTLWKRLDEQYPQLSIHTNTAVESIATSSEADSHPYVVNTTRGTIRARRILHATNAYATHLLPRLRTSLTGGRGQMTALRAGSKFPVTHGKRSWSLIYAPGFDYVTQRPDQADGSPGDIMLGGGFLRSQKQGMDQLGVWNDGEMDALPLMHVRGSLATIFEPRWGGGDGGGGELKKAWTGIMGFTGDMIPFVGRVPETISERVVNKSAGCCGCGEWIAAGFNGHGMVWAWLSGTAAAIKMLGKEKDESEKGVGRPGGKLDAWFPADVVALSEERLRRAELKNLADEVM